MLYIANIVVVRVIRLRSAAAGKIIFTLILLCLKFTSFKYPLISPVKLSVFAFITSYAFHSTGVLFYFSFLC
jgi:hypothetical protein